MGSFGRWLVLCIVLVNSNNVVLLFCGIICLYYDQLLNTVLVCISYLILINKYFIETKMYRILP